MAFFALVCRLKQKRQHASRVAGLAAVRLAAVLIGWWGVDLIVADCRRCVAEARASPQTSNRFVPHGLRASRCCTPARTRASHSRLASSTVHEAARHKPLWGKKQSLPPITRSQPPSAASPRRNVDMLSSSMVSSCVIAAGVIPNSNLSRYEGTQRG
jgi:hypothetical protein